jgi:xanthine dehydrogenase YagR molybdenum-binding subunit
MATKWPEKRRLIGTKVKRLDGPDKATGKAKYSFDINRPGMLHGMILRSPYARARIKSLDLTPAEKMPGVKAVIAVGNAKEGKELYYAGDEIAAVAADTEEHAQDALRAIKVEYDVLEHLVLEEDALRNPTKKTLGGPGSSNVGNPATASKGDVEAAFGKSDAVASGTYGASTICHHCLESHGLVAEWDTDGGLTLWASTQATVAVAGGMVQPFGVPAGKVKCITHYMGGGFGSKFGAGVEGNTAVQLAKKAGAPVKLMLNRAEEASTAGNRPSVYGTVKIAGNKDGSITAYEVDCYGTGGIAGGNTVNINLLPYVYMDAIPNWKRTHRVIRTNAGGARAFRAPGHPQNCIMTEPAVDDLAAKLDIDPLIIRRKNLPPNDPAVRDSTSWNAIRNTLYNQQLDIAVKLSGWKEKWHPPGRGPGSGPVKHGLGMAIHTWGGGAQGGQPNQCTVLINRDGSVTAESSTQDLGTGMRTVAAVVVAEILGLEPADVVTKLGESNLGHSTGSGGSTTTPSQAPAVLRGAVAARDDLFAKVGPRIGSDPKDLTIEAGKVVDSKNNKSWSWKEFCARLGMDQAKGVGDWNVQMSNQAENAHVSSIQVGGVQVAECTVDTETGVVVLKHMVAVQDCGLVVNRLTCESQISGGVIMGLNYAMFEERMMDRNTGRQVNPDMEFYKLGGIRDMPKVTVHLMDMPERGVIGVGEPPIVSTAAAISNAVFNAIGVRVPILPLTPKRVLDALAKGGKALS